MITRLFRSAVPLILTFLFLITTITFPPAAYSQSGTKTISTVTPTSTAAKIISGDGTISSISIVNVGSVIAYIGNSSSVTASNGTPVAPNTYFEMDHVTDDVWAITASSTTDLRLTIIRGGGVVRNGRLITSGISNSAAANTIGMSDGTSIVAGNALFYNLTTAITPGTTATSTAAGTLAITSNATGRGSVFQSDGSNWQLLSFYNGFNQQSTLQTVATTGNTDDYLVAPYAAILVSVDCSGIDALTADDTNYITYTLTNLGQAGSGSTAMLAATNPNTTKATGGTGLAANTKRTLTVHGTAGNLVTAAGDRLRLREAATGTLANTVTGHRCTLRFTRTV